MKGKPDTKESATRAIQMLAAAEPSPISSQQVAVLVSGSLLMCSWQYISDGLQQFESRGLRCLVEAWLVIAASVGLGQLAKIVARSAGLDDQVRRHPAVQDETNDDPSSRTTSSSCSSSHQQELQDLLNNAADKEGLEVAAGEQQSEDADDVGVQKRVAQAEAAAKLAEYRNHLQQLLASINSSADISNSTDMLLKVAQQLFDSPMNVCELVNQGGVSVMLAAARSALRSLGSSSGALVGCNQVLPALLQVSWVLLHIAHGPAACCAALSNQDVAATLLEVTTAVIAAPAQKPEAKEAVLRNLCWIMLLLCDTQNSASRSMASGSQQAAAVDEDSSASPATAAVACASALCDAGVINVLQQLVSLQFGMSAGWVAAATVGLFTQLDQQQQQQQALCVAAAQAMLHPDSLRGVACMLHSQSIHTQSDRLQALVHCQVHNLLTQHTQESLRLLVEEHLVGAYAAALPPKLARLLVCQLLSSRGQQVLSSVEESYELDVALALAQIIPLPLHVKLPPAPARRQQQHEQQQQEEIEPAADDGQELVGQPSAAGAEAAEDVYTDILASRLLLQHERLGELVTAFAEDLMEQQQQQQQSSSPQQQQQQEPEEHVQAAAAAEAAVGQPSNQQQLSSVCEAVLNLMRHLMSRDLELQAAQHGRGESIDSDSQTSSSSSAAGSSTSSSGNDTAALGSAGLNHLGMTSSAAAGQLSAAPAAGRGEGSEQQEPDQQLLSLPPLPTDAAAAVTAAAGFSSSGSSRRSVVFKFGDRLEHTVGVATYKQIRSSSKMINSILSRDGKRPARPVTVFLTPSFTPAANKWVLQCLERWLVNGNLLGFTPQQAAKLWVAADFWQVDGLQVACEDVIIAAAAAAATAGSAESAGLHLHLAFQVCSLHPASSSRLQRLAVQTLMRRLSDAYGSNAQHAAAVELLQQLLAEYKAVLLPCLLAELRDRLVTLCMLNAGLDADTLHDMVE